MHGTAPTAAGEPQPPCVSRSVRACCCHRCKCNYARAVHKSGWTDVVATRREHVKCLRRSGRSTSWWVAEVVLVAAERRSEDGHGAAAALVVSRVNEWDRDRDCGWRSVFTCSGKARSPGRRPWCRSGQGWCRPTWPRCAAPWRRHACGPCPSPPCRPPGCSPSCRYKHRP